MDRLTIDVDLIINNNDIGRMLLAMKRSIVPVKAHNDAMKPQENIRLQQEVQQIGKRQPPGWRAPTVNSAMGRAAVLPGLDKYGGIDLNAANLNLQIKRDGKGVPLPIIQTEFREYKY